MSLVTDIRLNYSLVCSSGFRHRVDLQVVKSFGRKSCLLLHVSLKNESRNHCFMESTAIHLLKVVFISTDCCFTCSHPNQTSKSVSSCSEINVSHMNEKGSLINLF